MYTRVTNKDERQREGLLCSFLDFLKPCSCSRQDAQTAVQTCLQFSGRFVCCPMEIVFPGKALETNVAAGLIAHACGMQNTSVHL